LTDRPNLSFERTHRSVVWRSFGAVPCWLPCGRAAQRRRWAALSREI